MRPSDRAWLVLTAGVIAYDALASPGETLSEGADRYAIHHKWLTRGVCIAVAAHVGNMIDDRLDPIHWAFLGARTARHHLR